ncbi:hypothetical protein VTP01DRAFT_8872 [Rhizomucor pusillus]|uniref:uncharacterized protein n=1 Tax=Rhizomucor pusillus TaxID=4840 RepID=UPI00374489A5
MAAKDKQHREDVEDRARENKYHHQAWLLERLLFFLGFLFPLLWFVGSSDCCGCREAPPGSYALVWKKRCRIAATLFLTVAIVTAATIMIVHPSTFGLRTGNSSGTQTTSASDSAIRPGVPQNGTGTWGDTAAGISVQGEPDPIPFIPIHPE